MSENNKSSNFKNEKDFSLMQFLSGNILTRESLRKNIWFILFLVLLSVIYINNKYKTESLLLNIIRLQNEVKEYRDRSVSYASELMSISRESEVIKIIEDKELDLKELKMPPEKIEVKN